MLNELNRQIESDFEPDEVDCTIIDVRLDGEDLASSLKLHSEYGPDTNWSLRAKNALGWQLSPRRRVCPPRIVSEHPVLLPYQFPTVSLYLNRTLGSEKQLIADLIHAHAEVCGAWLHPFDYLRLDIIRPAPEPSFGLLATAPAKLIHRYREVVLKNGGSASIAGEIPLPTIDGPPVVALILGDFWIVARDFEVTRSE
ncbi:MAG: hypothetical protein AAF958_13755 [Planctomycetota bacterium]